MRPRRRQQGFTLLEVMVATTIMAIAVTALLSSLARSNENAARLQDRDRIVALARTQMQELLLMPALPHAQPLEGRWERAHTGAGIEAGWTARVEPITLQRPLTPPLPGTVVLREMLPAAAPGRVLDRVTLEAWWKSPGAGARKTYTIQTYKRGLLLPAELGLPTP